jgi:hypothetical protein
VAEVERLERGLRLVAEDFLGLDTRVQALAADPEGCLVVVLAPPPGRELEAVADALAQLEFLTPRVADWLKLAPDLPLDPAAGARALLVAEAPGARAVAAAAALGHHRVAFVRPVPEQREQREPVSPSRFRTGLRDEDLGLLPAG